VPRGGDQIPREPQSGSLGGGTKKTLELRGEKRDSKEECKVDHIRSSPRGEKPKKKENLRSTIRPLGGTEGLVFIHKICGKKRSTGGKNMRERAASKGGVVFRKNCGSDLNERKTPCGGSYKLV